VSEADEAVRSREQSVHERYCTTIVPCSMFMPHENAISPDFCGVNSITIGSFSGSAGVMFKDGKTTAVPHVLSVVRTNVTRARVPARNVSCAGS